MNGNKISVLTLSALLGALGGIFAFFDQIHARYVTKNEMEVRLLESENRLLRERDALIRQIYDDLGEGIAKNQRKTHNNKP